jgi:hypothetical protein
VHCKALSRYSREIGGGLYELLKLAEDLPRSFVPFFILYQTLRVFESFSRVLPHLHDSCIVRHLETPRPMMMGRSQGSRCKVKEHLAPTSTNIVDGRCCDM